MDTLRKPFFLAATLCLLLVVLVEVGQSFQGDAGQARPGFGIPYMALIDGVLLYNIALMGLALIIPERVQGRVQGLVTLILSTALLLGTLVLGLVAFATLSLMLAMVLSFFGWPVYLVAFGGFDRHGAAITLALLMTFKLAFAVLLVMAHQRFLQNRSLVMLILTSFICGLMLVWLHALVPGVLVSVTDAIGAIVIAVLAFIWGLLLLIGGAVSTVKSIRLRV
ncbi:hypothetical protein QR90_08410 [Deinococcus radiopugnans]|uniref:Uncharacterized protein n=1 Tax=Deinococcus radiopugnans TaxID=57497 RepID=A0A0A7KG18_9DEIO|nr:hypothetical protein [Deinococcus radiopugnans]AIZ45122.1 hypothetical protein QR90_08410 [Deinococcus radiopugnans]